MTGDIAESRRHLDQAIALYDPAEHRPLATRFGQDAKVTALSYRSNALWLLGYPEAALRDADDALEDAREMGQAATLMLALNHAAIPYTLCGNYAVAAAHAQEQVALAEEKGSLFWKANGMMNQGDVLALTGRASDAIEILISGIAAFRATGATLLIPFHLPHLARAHVELGQFEEAWRCIGEAMNVGGNNQGKVVRGGHPPNGGGNRADVARAGRGESGGAFRACHRHCPRAAGKVLGAARRDELGSFVAESGPAQRSARPARADLQLVHRRLRHARSARSKGDARAVGVSGYSTPAGWSALGSNYAV